VAIRKTKKHLSQIGGGKVGIRGGLVILTANSCVGNSTFSGHTSVLLVTWRSVSNYLK